MGGGSLTPFFFWTNFLDRVKLGYTPRPSGSALKVPGGGWVGWETPIIIITLHLVEFSWVELRVDQLMWFCYKAFDRSNPKETIRDMFINLKCQNYENFQIGMGVSALIYLIWLNHRTLQSIIICYYFFPIYTYSTIHNYISLL